MLRFRAEEFPERISGLGGRCDPDGRLYLSIDSSPSAWDTRRNPCFSPILFPPIIWKSSKKAPSSLG